MSTLELPGDSAFQPLWHAEATARPALTGRSEVDVAIVGAGYTGLWTAYYLLKQDPALRVALVEKEHVGYGASGRNGGWVSAIFPVSMTHVAKATSVRRALALQRAMNHTVDEIGRVVSHEHIRAEFAKSGFVSLARSAAHLSRARRTVAESESLGMADQWRILGAAEASSMVAATGVTGALFTDHCAVVDPGRLVRGLAGVVERLGARIYEHSPVLQIEPGQVLTREGTVRAEVVVRATEAFTAEFAEHRRAVAPLYSLVLATEPLPQDLAEQLGLTHRRAFNDLRHLRIYAQMTAAGRLVFGGRGAPYHFGSRISSDFDRSGIIHERIRATMVDLFPALAGVQITHRWGGPLGVARDWHPSVGLDPSTGLAWAGAYVGDGVATSNLAGRILRNLILKLDDDLNDLPIVNHRSRNWEVEPFRWAGVNLGLRAAAFGDVEERLTHRPSRVAHLLERLTGAH